MVEAKIRAMLDAYNYDGSDIQSDYFNVNFYGHVDYDHGLTWGEHTAFEARINAGEVKERPAGDRRPSYERREAVKAAVAAKPEAVAKAPTPAPVDPQVAFLAHLGID